MPQFEITSVDTKVSYIDPANYEYKKHAEYTADFSTTKVPRKLGEKLLNEVQKKADDNDVKVSNLQMEAYESYCLVSYNTTIKDGREYFTIHWIRRHRVHKVDFAAQIAAMFGVVDNDEIE